MKKKKLKKTIDRLKSENNTLKNSECMWKDMVFDFVQKLDACGVRTDIIYPDTLIIEVTMQDDGTRELAPGIDTEPPKIKFDFTEHDSRLVPWMPKNFW